LTSSVHVLDAMKYTGQSLTITSKQGSCRVEHYILNSSQAKHQILSEVTYNLQNSNQMYYTQHQH